MGCLDIAAAIGFDPRGALGALLNCLDLPHVSGEALIHSAAVFSN